jgi:hypothetical protein
LQAYQEILEKEPNAVYKQRHSALLNQLAKVEPDNPAVLSALAGMALKQGTLKDYSQAINHLERAIALGSMGTDDYLVTGRTDAAVRLGIGSQ